MSFVSTIFGRRSYTPPKPPALKREPLGDEAFVTEMHASLAKRMRPEDVIERILETRFDTLATREQLILDKARPIYRYTSMSREFARADDLSRQLSRAEILFGATAPRAGDTEAVRGYLEDCAAQLGARDLDFKTGRLNRDQRALVESAPDGHRAYNKRFRLLRRMEKKLGKCIEVTNIRDLAQVAKSRLACHIRREDMRDPDTAAFLAYMTARLNLRSQFTSGPQVRAYDDIADLLFKRLAAGADWYAVAHVHVAPEVVAHLTEEQRGRLLGAWYSVMVRAAKVLDRQVTAHAPDLVNLIVRRGDDSSTWNEAAGAFNKARDGWVNCLYALGAHGLLDRFAPGKALRLMAADVAYLHRAKGGGLEPDTMVWRDLPRPWDVVLNGAFCDRTTIERACARAGIEGKGWVAPRPPSVAEYTPTPELVHGVTVGCPLLADAMRRCGWFAGPSKWGA